MICIELIQVSYNFNWNIDERSQPQTYKCKCSPVIGNVDVKWKPVFALTGFFDRLDKSNDQWTCQSVGKDLPAYHIIMTLGWGNEKICVFKMQVHHSLKIWNLRKRGVKWQVTDLLKKPRTCMCEKKQWWEKGILFLHIPVPWTTGWQPLWYHCHMGGVVYMLLGSWVMSYHWYPLKVLSLSTLLKANKIM